MGLGSNFDGTVLHCAGVCTLPDPGETRSGHSNPGARDTVAIPQARLLLRAARAVENQALTLLNTQTASLAAPDSAGAGALDLIFIEGFTGARFAPGTATGDFSILLSDMPSLDANPAGAGDTAGYAAFGHVVAGMDVARKIFEAPLSPTAGEGALKGQMLVMPVKIISARRVAVPK